MDGDSVAFNLEQNAIVTDAKPVFRGRIGESFDVAAQVV